MQNPDEAVSVSQVERLVFRTDGLWDYGDIYGLFTSLRGLIEGISILTSGLKTEAPSIFVSGRWVGSNLVNSADWHDFIGWMVSVTERLEAKAAYRGTIRHVGPAANLEIRSIHMASPGWIEFVKAVGEFPATLLREVRELLRDIWYRNWDEAIRKSITRRNLRETAKREGYRAVMALDIEEQKRHQEQLLADLEFTEEWVRRFRGVVAEVRRAEEDGAFFASDGAAFLTLHLLRIRELLASGLIVGTPDMLELPPSEDHTGGA